MKSGVDNKKEMRVSTRDLIVSHTPSRHPIPLATIQPYVENIPHLIIFQRKALLPTCLTRSPALQSTSLSLFI